MLPQEAEAQMLRVEQSGLLQQLQNLTEDMKIDGKQVEIDGNRWKTGWNQVFHGHL